MTLTEALALVAGGKLVAQRLVQTSSVTYRFEVRVGRVSFGRYQESWTDAGEVTDCTREGRGVILYLDGVEDNLMWSDFPSLEAVLNAFEIHSYGIVKA